MARTPTSEVMLPLTPRPLPSPQHGRASTPQRSNTAEDQSSPSPAEKEAAAAAEDWWRWPTPTKEDATSQRLFVEIGASSKGGVQPMEDGGRVKMLGEWRVGSTVGHGTSGRVRLARSTLTGHFAAVKKVKRLPAGHRQAEAIHREISMMKLVEHHHILQLLDVFETPSHFFLVTDYCPHGEVFHYVLSHNLGTESIYRWFVQLVSALAQLHLLGIAHRDIKFENLFLFKDVDGGLSLKLGDLGMASFQPDGRLLETSCGSPHYAAPEVIQGLPYDGMAADIWSSGVVLYALHARALPFDNDHVPTLLAMIKEGVYEMDPSITGDAKDLVERMLEKDVSLRISLGEILCHPFLTSRAGTLDVPGPIYPPTDCEAPTAEEQLEEDVLTNLQVVMRTETKEETADLVLSGSPRAKHFYSTLARFKTKLTVIPAETSVRHTPRMGRRRSISMPDIKKLPRPSTLAVPSLENLEERPRSRRGARPLSRIEALPESAPPETTTYVFPAPPAHTTPPKNARRALSQMLLSSTPILESDNEEVSSAPAHVVEFESMFGRSSPDPLSFSLPVASGVESRSYSLLNSSQSSKRSTLSKKPSFQQRVKGLFKRDDSLSGSLKGSSVIEHSSLNNDDLPPASPLRTSFHKRSTGYSSLHRAIVALAPSSPSPMRSAFTSELGPFPRGPGAATPTRKKSFARLLGSRNSKVPDEPLQFAEDEATLTREEKSPNLLHPHTGGRPPAASPGSPPASPTPSSTKRRPSPLTLTSSNIPGKSSPRPPLQRNPTTASQVLFGSGARTRSPRSPLSETSSNENDPFTLGSPFQPHSHPTQSITPSDRRPSKSARLRELEDENSALKVEITLLMSNQTIQQTTIDAQQKEIEALKAETSMLWRKIEESLEAKRSVEEDRDELQEMVRRLSFDDDGRDSKTSEKLEAKWMRMLGVKPDGDEEMSAEKDVSAEQE